MGTKYQHLSASERDRISFWKGQGLSIRQIASRLGRSPATLSRELHRNSAPHYRNCYLARRAQRRAEQRWGSRHRKPRLKSPALRQYVRQQLQVGWSPELIAGRLSGQTQRERISHEAIYQWIYTEARELIGNLARSHRRRRRRGYSRKHRKAHIPGRVSIRKRPGTPGPTSASQCTAGRKARSRIASDLSAAGIPKAQTSRASPFVR
jgi:transposase, IS30 family